MVVCYALFFIVNGVFFCLFHLRLINEVIEKKKSYSTSLLKIDKENFYPGKIDSAYVIRMNRLSRGKRELAAVGFEPTPRKTGA